MGDIRLLALVLLGIVRRDKGLKCGLGISLRLRLALGSALGGGEGGIVPKVLQELLLGLAVHGFGASGLDIGLLGDSFKVNLVRLSVSVLNRHVYRE